MQSRRVKGLFDVVTGLAIIVLAGVAIKSAWWPTAPRTADPIQRVITVPPTDVPLSPRALLQRGANVAIIEFADFECSFCRKFAREVLPELRARQAELGIVIDFRHRPSPRRPNSASLAVAAECAHDHREFWKLHDAFFAKADGVAQLDASLYVSELGDNPKKLETCTAASKSRLARDMTIAERFRIPGTPTFLVGIIKADGGVSVRRKLLGSQTIEQIQEVVEEVRKEG